MRGSRTGRSYSSSKSPFTVDDADCLPTGGVSARRTLLMRPSSP